MKAARCHAFGPVETLRVEEAPDPVPGRGEVLIDVRAAGVNFPDGLMVRGEYQMKPPTPFIPGSEVAGTVAAVGDGVGEYTPGDRVIGYCGLGGFAERVAVEASRVVPMPDGMGYAEAAGLVLVYGTSMHALADRAALRAGETLLVLGAAGGVGLAAVEIGAALGARVVAAASTPEKCALARAHGAEIAIDYAGSDLRAELKRIAPGGVDVVYDPVGGAATEAAVRGLGWGGRLLVVGFAAGDIPRLPLNLLLLKEAAAMGVFWGAFVQRDPDANARNLAQLLRWYTDGKIRPHVSAEIPLSRVTEALETVMQRRALGKVVVVPG